MGANPQPATIIVDNTHRVSGLLQTPPEARACYIMAHAFMAAMANGLAERGVATLRYQFPYMEQGSKRPDTPKLAQATVRAAVAEASRLLPELALFAGGKSFGGRMTSQAQAVAPLPEVRGLIFLGFPLHPPGKPAQLRVEHFSKLRVPALFVHGTRDPFGSVDEMREAIQLIPVAARLQVVDGAGHGVPPGTAVSMPAWFNEYVQ